MKPEDSEFVAGAIMRDADLDDLAGLDPSSVELRSRLKDHMSRRKEIDDLREVARVATRAALERYEPIPEDWSKLLTLGTVFDGDDRVFELYVAAERPSDAIVLTSARVNRITRAVSVTVTNLKER